MKCVASKLLQVLLLWCALASAAQARDIWSKVERVVAVGDLHGDYSQYLQILRDNALIDADLNWQGGNTHLVQIGDVADRGPDSLKIMRHLRQLEKQARRKRGYVHVLLGNHEAMNIQDDLRYVHPGEYQILVNERSAALQADYIRRVMIYQSDQRPALSAETPAQTAERRRLLEQQFPLGYVEHRLLWSPKGEVFEWLKSNNAVIKINRTLFVHGGLSPHQPLQSIKKINRDVRKALLADPQDPALPSNPLGEQGPLWYRGLARGSAETELEPLKALLAYYDADRIVIAHTPTSGAIMPRFDGRVIRADVGLGAAYGNRQASLLIEEDGYFAVHRGQRVPLPLTDAELAPYLKEVAALEPDPTAINKTLQRLE